MKKSLETVEEVREAVRKTNKNFKRAEITSVIIFIIGVLGVSSAVAASVFEIRKRNDVLEDFKTSEVYQTEILAQTNEAMEKYGQDPALLSQELDRITSNQNTEAILKSTSNPYTFSYQAHEENAKNWLNTAGAMSLLAFGTLTTFTIVGSSLLNKRKDYSAQLEEMEKEN